MALKLKSVQAQVKAQAGAKAVLPVRRSINKLAVIAQAQKPAVEAGKVMAAAAAASTALVASSAQAATEVAQLAAGDNRPVILASLLVPVVGWVGFNIISGLQAQVDRMDDMRKGVAGAVGLSAAGLLLAENAQAATEISQLAAGDNRAGILATLLLPALGWVGFNIISGLQAQVDRMDDMRKGVAGAVGLSAAGLLFAESAQAATEISQLAAGDNRPVILASLLVPVVGWVGFNIISGLQAQVERMDDMRNGAAGAIGLTAASLLFTESASAAQEFAQIAAGDNRPLILASLLLPVVGWVGFNIISGLQAQVERMGEMKDD